MTIKHIKAYKSIHIHKLSLSVGQTTTFSSNGSLWTSFFQHLLPHDTCYPCLVSLVIQGAHLYPPDPALEHAESSAHACSSSLLHPIQTRWFYHLDLKLYTSSIKCHPHLLINTFSPTVILKYSPLTSNHNIHCLIDAGVAADVYLLIYKR